MFTLTTQRISLNRSLSLEKSQAIMSILVVLSLTLMLSAFATGSTPPEGETRLVVNAQVPTQSMSIRELGYIFSGRRGTWPKDGSAIQLILFPDDSQEMKWLSKKLRMPPRLIRRFIHHRVYQGAMRSPIEVRSVEEALKALSMHRGSITPIHLNPARLKQIQEGGELSKSVRLVRLSHSRD